MRIINIVLTTDIKMHGLTVIYNALAAYAVGRFMDVTPAKIAHALSDNDEQVFGRQETFHVGEKDVTLILVKNPVGLNQVLQTISTDDRPFSFAALLNANYADVLI